jgi:hypothetical protein
MVEIIVIVAAIIVLIIGAIVYEKTYDLETTGTALMSIGGIVGGAALLATVILICINGSNYGIDQKIELYEQENQQIEEDIAVLVNQYMKHEENIFIECSPDSSITLVALYPELKSDLLIEKQIEIYVSNTEEIKQLKTDRISAYIIKWWLYFGG